MPKQRSTELIFERYCNAGSCHHTVFYLSFFESLESTILQLCFASSRAHCAEINSNRDSMLKGPCAPACRSLAVRTRSNRQTAIDKQKRSNRQTGLRRQAFARHPERRGGRAAAPFPPVPFSPCPAAPLADRRRDAERGVVESRERHRQREKIRERERETDQRETDRQREDQRERKR